MNVLLPRLGPPNLPAAHPLDPGVQRAEHRAARLAIEATIYL